MKNLYTKPPCKIGDIVTTVTPPDIQTYPYCELQFIRWRYRVIAEDGEMEIVDKQTIPARVVYLPQYSTFGFEPMYDYIEGNYAVVARTEPGQPDLRWKD